MRKLAIIDEAAVPASDRHAAHVDVDGLISSKLLSPPDYELWLCHAELVQGATITWPAIHGDEVLYVFSGALDVDGHRCVAGGAVVVEADVAATVTAIEPSRIGHYGSRTRRHDRDGRAVGGPVDGSDGASTSERRKVHVVGPNGIVAWGEPETLAVRFLADSSCPTCSVSLFEVARDTARRGRPHSHSSDEIIYVVSGTMHLGAITCTPGTSVCIPGGVRYAEASGEDGCTFLNFRPEASDRVEFPKGEPPRRTMEDPHATPDVEHPRDVVDVYFD